MRRRHGPRLLNLTNASIASGLLTRVRAIIELYLTGVHRGCAGLSLELLLGNRVWKKRREDTSEFLLQYIYRFASKRVISREYSILVHRGECREATFPAVSLTAIGCLKSRSFYCCCPALSITFKVLKWGRRGGGHAWRSLVFRERYFGWLARGGWGTMPPTGGVSGALCAGDLNYLKRPGVTQHPGGFTSKHSQMGLIQSLG